MCDNGKKLILFDIDGTLISTGGAGTRSMNLAFHALFGILRMPLRVFLAHIASQVATGPYSKEYLLNTDADIGIDSLAQTGDYMNFIMSY